MANCPRRSRLTQTFAVPDEDDIYDDASIAPLDKTGTAEDTNNTNLIDINKTITAFLNNANSQSRSTAPLTPLPVTLRQRLEHSFSRGREAAVHLIRILRRGTSQFGSRQEYGYPTRLKGMIMAIKYSTIQRTVVTGRVVNL
jgi:hypothetical protein